jgi:glycosyltransferase involved in cell wall biosynthesis
MKKISIIVPCFNEEKNIVAICNAIVDECVTKLQDYDYELIVIDNYSTDTTRILIREICRKNKKIKAIFNARNFGQFNSPYYAMLQSTGDCTITICADFQDPVELIPIFVREWEQGNKIVIGIKNKSEENRFIRFLRTCYYKTIKRMSNVEQIEHFTGFGLYDKQFIEVLRELKDPTPFLRGIVAELGFKIKKINYTQAKRRAGKTHNNFFTLFDAAMLGFTSYTKTGLRIATFVGIFSALVSFGIGLYYLIYKLMHWYTFSAGMIPILVGVFFIGGLQLFFIGFLGEYITSINQRIMNRPLVIEEERINFPKSSVFPKNSRDASVEWRRNQ